MNAPVNLAFIAPAAWSIPHDAPVEQGSPEWLAMRAGRFTGSKFWNVVARGKRDGKPLKPYWDLVWELVVERLTGVPAEGPQGYALQWGHDLEPHARGAVELETGLEITTVDFVVHPQLPHVGSSPDGLIGLDGGLELKCPKDPKVHLERFFSGMPEEYEAQVQGNLWVTGRQWWLFASYDPRQVPSLQLYLQYVPRDAAYIAHLEQCVAEAEAEVQKRLQIVFERGLHAADCFARKVAPTAYKLLSSPSEKE